MKFKANKITDVLDAPGGKIVDALTPNQVVIGTGRVSDPFTEVDVGAGLVGWVATADLTSLDPTVRPALNTEALIRDCLVLERSINNLPATAPWFVAADFLIARGIVETGLANLGPKFPGSDATGPLQVSSDEWRAFLAIGGALAAPFQPFNADDFDNPLMQVWGAGFRMVSDARSIGALKSSAGGAGDAFVPSYLDVFHAYLTGDPKAAVAILDAQATDLGKASKIDAVLSGVLTANQVQSLFATRGKYLGSPAAPKTVLEFVAATEADLKVALGKAFDLMQQLAPDELAPVKQGEAHWFDVAETEEAKNVVESDVTKSGIILNYFNATDIDPKPTSVSTAWCGAFAAYCMKTSGLPVPAAAALAKSWKNWGDPFELGNPGVPVGAVVVLSPDEGTDSTGHVGFFVRFVENGSKVELLGGNQHNGLNRRPFLRSKIAAIRWVDSEASSPSGQFDATPSHSAISEAAFNLIVAAEVSSPSVYERKYRGPTWPGLRSGLTVGIGYDVGQTSANVVESDWQHVVTPAMLAALKSAVGVVGPAARTLTQKLKDQIDISFAQAIHVHRDRVIPRWVSVVEKVLGPNTSTLSPDCLGALVSLAYNRGASFSAAGPRYAEMRKIKELVGAGQFTSIPAQFRSMKRLWPNVPGLLIRREKEAQMFEGGL